MQCVLREFYWSERRDIARVQETARKGCDGSKFYTSRDHHIQLHRMRRRP